MTLTAGDLDWVRDRRPLSDLPVSSDPLRFPGYREQLARAEERSGAGDSVTPLRATIAGRRTMVALFDFAFLGGSMGEATGRRLELAIDAARTERLPLVTITASGGARMQEGMHALVQMQRVAGALQRLRAAGVPHLNVALHPTTGGVWASMASAADVIVAVEGATVAFAGARVRGVASDGVEFTALGKLDAGAVDVVVDPDELEAVVGAYVRAMSAVLATDPVRCPPPDALPGADRQADGWDAVQLARSPDLPRADDYLAAEFEQTVELVGDRVSGRDLGMRCGIGLRDGNAVAFVAQTGTANTPAGFRTATRVLRMADRWQIPVLTLIDTPGARNDARAEREGLGTAIAETFAAMAEVQVPVTSLVVGEGGSGGALAIASPGHLWAVPSSCFSVIAPEGAAAILHRDRGRAPEIAEQLALAPADLLAHGIIRGIVEPATSRSGQGVVA